MDRGRERPRRPGRPPAGASSGWPVARTDAVRVRPPRKLRGVAGRSPVSSGAHSPRRECPAPRPGHRRRDRVPGCGRGCRPASATRTAQTARRPLGRGARRPRHARDLPRRVSSTDASDWVATSSGSAGAGLLTRVSADAGPCTVDHAMSLVRSGARSHMPRIPARDRIGRARLSRSPTRQQRKGGVCLSGMRGPGTTTGLHTPCAISR